MQNMDNGPRVDVKTHGSISLHQIIEENEAEFGTSLCLVLYKLNHVCGYAMQEIVNLQNQLYQLRSEMNDLQKEVYGE